MPIMNMTSLFQKSVLALLGPLFCTAASCQSPAGNTFTTGEIPQLYKFEKLTEREAKMDTRMFQRWQESLAGMEDGTAFREGVSAADQAK